MIDDTNPIAVVEYNGAGHYNNQFEKRDRIKQTATENAGILYYQILETELSNIDDYIERKIKPAVIASRDKAEIEEA
ncbi:MAG: DUF2726 domain-containing protein [Pseudomonadota bacterium]